MPAWTAVILSGGKGRRLGNVEKSTLQINGESLLDLVLATLPTDVPVIVVGPEVPTKRSVRFLLEQPRFGGPVAGLAAALPHVQTELMGVLATDMPRAGALLPALVDAHAEAGAEALIPRDAAGRSQYLCAVYATAALQRAVQQLPAVEGAALRAVIEQLRVHEPALTDEQRAALTDIDTPDDLRAAQTPPPISG